MEPRTLPFGIWHEGRSLPVLCYDSPPEGCRKARTTDLTEGTPVLYKVTLGPDKGRFYTDIVRMSNYETLLARINRGDDIYTGNYNTLFKPQ